MDRQKIVENFNLEVRQKPLMEAEAKEVGNVWTSPVWRLDEKNLNGHTYTRALAEKVCKKYKQTMAYDGHDADMVTGHDFAPAVAIVRDPRIEGNEMVVDIEFLGTESARASVENIKELYSKGVAIGVSSVGYGSCDADGVIGEDYEVVRFLDFVACPAGEVYAEPKTESTDVVDVVEEVEKTEEPLAEAEEVSEPSVTTSELSEGEASEVVEADKEESEMVLNEERLAEERSELEEARKLKEASKMTEAITNKNGRWTEESVQWMQGIKEAISGRGSYSGLIPVEVADRVMMLINDYGKIYNRCRKFNLRGNYEFAVQGSGATVDYVAEAGSYGEATPTLNVIALGAYKLAAKVIISEETDDLAINMLDYVVEMLARGFAEKLDNEILHGTGSSNSHLTGILYSIKNTSGYTDQKVTDTNSLGAFTWTNLKKTMELVGSYADGAVLIMSNATRNYIHEFKDNGKYIFDQNQPLTAIWGMPIIISDKSEAYATDTKYPVIVANLNYYAIGIREDMQTKVCDQTLAASGQNLIVSKMRVDGKPCTPKAFAALLTDF